MNRTDQIALLIRMHQDKLISETELREMIARLGSETPTNAAAPPSLPSPIVVQGSSTSPKRNLKVIVTAVIVVLLASLFTVNKISSSQQEAKTRRIEQKAQDDLRKIEEQKAQDDLRKIEERKAYYDLQEKLGVMACGEYRRGVSQWDVFVKSSNESANNLKGDNLTRAREMAFGMSRALESFLQSIKAVQSSQAVIEINALIASIREHRDSLAYMAGAYSQSELNRLIAKMLITHSQLSEAKDDWLAALKKICA